MEGTAPAETVTLVTAEPIKACKISPTGATNTIGIKNAVNASSHIKAEETLMLSTTTATGPQMQDCGKSTTSTGDNAVKAKLPAIPK